MSKPVKRRGRARTVTFAGGAKPTKDRVGFGGLKLGKRKREREKSRQPISLVQFFRESPLVGAELDLEREPDKS
jgi:hypothetical protein